MKREKVLLIFQSPVQRRLHLNIMPPLGILGISSFLASKSVANRVIDYNIMGDGNIKMEDFEVVMFSVNIANVTNSLLQARDIKKEFPKKRILFGGPYCTSNPYYFIKQEYIDAVVVGEGEETAYSYLTNEDSLRVKGLYLKGKEEEIIFTGEREYIENLDLLPYPAFDKVDIRKYSHFPGKAKPISSIVTSRGCVFRCTFCLHPLGYEWRARSPDNVVKEIEWQVKELRIKELCIYDDNFTFDEKRAEEICDLILERDIRINLQFPNGIHIKKIKKGLLEKLKEIGTHYIGIAPETGNRDTMHRIRKDLEEEQVKEVVNTCKKLKLRTLGFFILGFPWEGPEEIKRTIEFAKRIDTDLVQFTRLLPYKQTHLYDYMAAFDILPNDRHDEEKNPFCGGTAGVQRMIKTAYRSFYLRKEKILNLLMSFSPKDLLFLIRYAIVKKNI
jgi:anaerobic magnesium-protoporphyrin IX monomethyl ester cyclase